MANTKVYLLNVPLENDYKHTLYFASREAQTQYFISKAKYKSEDCTYQRKDSFIRFHEKFHNIEGCNYVMYQNPPFNKWYYAFVTDIKYIDEGRTDVYIETDALQTWLFDYIVHDSFVEREHVSDDTIGLHTVPEQLETGDYIINNQISNDSLKWKGYLVGATVDLSNSEVMNSDSGKFPDVLGGMYNGIYSGIRYFYFGTDVALNRVFKRIAETGQKDSIVCLFVVPSQYIELADGNPVAINTSLTAKTLSWNPGIMGITQENIYKPSDINGYTPKNNKLLTYPYCYCLMDNNAGGSAVYKYELFNNQNDSNLCDFEINFALTPGCSIRLIPIWYNGSKGLSNIDGLNSAKFPICNWTTDVYTNWLTQNAVNIPLQIASSAVTIAGGIGLMATGAGAAAGGGAVVSGALGIAGTIGEMYSHSLQPPQSEGNINSGDVTFSKGWLTFTAYQMSIKKEYAAIIDDYFTCYGYKINRVKKPNSNHRPRFWYTKTIDVNIDGASVPQKDLQVIKNCYNNGITFWRDASDINNYSDDNKN